MQELLPYFAELLSNLHFWTDTLLSSVSDVFVGAVSTTSRAPCSFYSSGWRDEVCFMMSLCVSEVFPWCDQGAVADRPALLLQRHRGSRLFCSPWKHGPSRHVLTAVLLSWPPHASYSDFDRTLTEHKSDEYIQQNFQTLTWFFLLWVTVNTPHQIQFFCVLSCLFTASFFSLVMFVPFLPLWSIVVAKRCQCFLGHLVTFEL